ncbi:hypothetical protein HMPREF0541_01690 [Lacticaseibacillus rhamnosus ATCC 21052]|nr:hypothetical protein HMPREF0541_01690 [Lacticaseibacillus rhamnosus ATCC 21052]
MGYDQQKPEGKIGCLFLNTSLSPLRQMGITGLHRLNGCCYHFNFLS